MAEHTPYTEAGLNEIEARAEKAAPGPWKTYPNPMRDDGLFVAQDKSIEPYSGTEGDMTGPKYPAVPNGAWGISVQLEHELARFIAAARTDVPRLCKEVRRLRDDLEHFTRHTHKVGTVLIEKASWGNPDGGSTVEYCPRCTKIKAALRGEGG